MDDLRWQTYDGAAYMAGCLNGVAARILSENPPALYVHCANHSLDLALKDCVKASKMIRGTLDLVQDWPFLSVPRQREWHNTNTSPQI